MPLSDPRPVFGIHHVMPYNRSTGLPYGFVRVTGGGEIGLSGERVDLYGGSNFYPWVSETTKIEASFNFTIKEYPDFIIELFLGGQKTAYSAEASGAASAIVNLSGTSIVAATGLLSTITVNTATDLKFGRYIIQATTANDIKVYTHSLIDQSKGTDLPSINDLGEITATELAVASGVDTAIPGLGIEVTGGASVTDFVIGDTAYFDLRPIHTGGSRIKLGAAGVVFPQFGVRMTAQKITDGRLYEVHAWKANASGMPISMTENEFSETDVEMRLLYDSAQDGVAEIIALDGE